jgi:hypothetical protein
VIQPWDRAVEVSQYSWISRESKNIFLGIFEPAQLAVAKFFRKSVEKVRKFFSPKQLPKGKWGSPSPFLGVPRRSERRFSRYGQKRVKKGPFLAFKNRKKFPNSPIEVPFEALRSSRYSLQKRFYEIFCQVEKYIFKRIFKKTFFRKNSRKCVFSTRWPLGSLGEDQRDQGASKSTTNHLCAPAPLLCPVRANRGEREIQKVRRKPPKQFITK